MKRYFFATFTVMFSCATALAAVQAQEILPPEPDSVEEIHLRAGQLPAINLTGELLYRILAAELAAQRGYFDMSSGWYLGLAQDTSDPRLAQKAFQASVLARDLQRAQRAAQHWVLLAPEDEDAIASAMALAASNGRTDGMASALQARIQRADDPVLAIRQAAAIVSKLSDKRAALDVLDGTLTPEMRQLPIARLALADAAWAAGDAQRAVTEARHAQQLDGDLESAAQRLLQYGLVVDAAQAEAEARAYLHQHPQASKLTLQLASHLGQQGQVDEALGLLQQLQRQAPENFDLLRVEAEINYRAGRLPQARELLLTYIQVQTQRRKTVRDEASNARADAADARLMLVQIAQQQGDLHEAILQLDQIDDPSLVFQAHVHKAVLQGQLGDLQQALGTLESLRPGSNEEHATVILTQATIYRDAGRSEQAIAWLEQATRRFPHMTEIKYDLAMMYERQGRFDDFETMMRDILDLDPDNANALNALGYTFVDQNVRLDEAGELLDRALQLEPDNPYILDSVGWYYYRIGEYDNARRYLEQSYNQLPAAEVAAHLGEALWQLGERQAAIDLWQEAAANEPDSQVLMRTMQRYGVTP